MRYNYWIIGLLALLAVIGLFMTGNPERAERLSQMYRDAAFQGEARQLVLFALAIGIGGFILYLTMTRR